MTDKSASEDPEDTGAENPSPDRDLERLLLVRYLLRQANDTYDDRNPRASGLALSLAQDAVEHLLWAAADHTGARVGTKHAPFDQLFDAVNGAQVAAGKASLPSRQALIRLNNARVSFKHHANLPDTRDARKHIGRAEDFCHVATEQVFGVSLQTASEAGLVEDKAVRRYLVEAERYFAEGAYKDCIVEATTAAQKALQQLTKYVPEGDRFPTWRMPRLADRPDLQEWAERYVRSVSERMSDIREVALMGQLGLKLGDYLAFRSVTPNVTFSLSGNRFVAWMGQSMLSDDKETAGFCHRFANDVALAVRRALGDLPRLDQAWADKVAKMRAAAAGESGIAKGAGESSPEG
jgi:hypothetical protein